MRQSKRLIWPGAFWVLSGLLAFTACAKAAPENPAASATPANASAVAVLSPTPSLVSSVPTATMLASPADTPPISSEALERFIAQTRDPDWKTRWDAVNALGELQDARALPFLGERAMQDDNSHPRWRSLWAIGNIESSGATVKPLLVKGLSDSDPMVVRNSAIALAFFYQAEGREEILKGLSDPDDYRRWEAVFSIKNVPSPEVVRALIAKLHAEQEPTEAVRSEAALSLGDMHAREAIGPLVTLLNSDPSSSVRLRAVLGLSRMGDRSVVSDLKQALDSESNGQVRAALQDAIASLDSG
ncbi:MAG: HEAT repeat domain-containing protein [Chloroflexi bacterium]|nr:HEAT repeat domain-containing protein [Chloroflexota bacterium]